MILPTKPGYTHLICGDICNIYQKMIRNLIFVHGGTFYPGLPFCDNFDKGRSPLDFNKKPNYKWSSKRFYFRPFTLWNFYRFIDLYYSGGSKKQQKNDHSGGEICSRMHYLKI